MTASDARIRAMARHYLRSANLPGEAAPEPSVASDEIDRLVERAMELPVADQDRWARWVRRLDRPAREGGGAC